MAIFSAQNVQLLALLIIFGVIAYLSINLYSIWLAKKQALIASDYRLERLRGEIGRISKARDQEQSQGNNRWIGFRQFRVFKKVPETKNITSFYFKPVDGKSIPGFQPGQYLTFQFSIPGQSKKVIRCYSLSESPLEKDYYRITVKRIPPPFDQPELPPGLSSSFLHDQLNEGDVVDVKVPSGNFVLDSTEQRPVVLIAGGIGITPLLCMANTSVRNNPDREIWLFYGVINRKEHIMFDHLKKMNKAENNLTLQVCYSDPLEEETKGKDFDYSEQISVDLLSKVLPSNNYDFYVCGPPPMMEALDRDLRAWGVPGANIHSESFGPASIRHKLDTTTQASGVKGDAASIAVEFSRSGKILEWAPSCGPLLDFAEANGIPIDFGCRAGSCGTCCTTVRSGDIDYFEEASFQAEEGTCLACIAYPKSPLVLDA